MSVSPTSITQAHDAEKGILHLLCVCVTRFRWVFPPSRYLHPPVFAAVAAIVEDATAPALSSPEYCCGTLEHLMDTKTQIRTTSCQLSMSKCHKIYISIFQGLPLADWCKCASTKDVIFTSHIRLTGVLRWISLDFSGMKHNSSNSGPNANTKNGIKESKKRLGLISFQPRV